MDSFGIYIQTYPGDFHLSLPLVKSLQYFHPDVPIMIIPGEGFDFSSHPFDIPIMPIPDGFWAQLGHQDRDFWCFQGPFETFLYLDADIICVKPIGVLIDRIKQQTGDFIFVTEWLPPEKWREATSDPSHEHHKAIRHLPPRVIGNISKLKLFDPEYDPLVRMPFTSGVFASRRLAIKEADVEALHRAEIQFHVTELKKPFSWKTLHLFERDQGRLNYLVEKLRIPVLDLKPGGWEKYGGLPLSVSVEDLESGQHDFQFIHWAGSPRPSLSLFCRKPLLGLMAWANVNVRPGYAKLAEIPAYSVWRHFYQNSRGPVKAGEVLRWTLKDLSNVREHLHLRLRKSASNFLRPFKRYLRAASPA